MRLRHAQLPEEARDLDKELRALLKEKDAAVRCQSHHPPRRCPRSKSATSFRGWPDATSDSACSYEALVRRFQINSRVSPPVLRAVSTKQHTLPLSSHTESMRALG